MDLSAIDAATAIGLVAAVASTAAAVISALVYRHQRRADGPGVTGEVRAVDRDGPWIYLVRFRLDPPGRPAREVKEVRIRSPKGVEITEYGVAPAWGRRVEFDLPDAEGAVLCRTSSPERQILQLDLRIGLWSKLSLKAEIADLL